MRSFLRLANQCGKRPESCISINRPTRDSNGDNNDDDDDDGDLQTTLNYCHHYYYDNKKEKTQSGITATDSTTIATSVKGTIAGMMGGRTVVMPP